MERLTRCVGFQNDKPIYKTNIDMRKIGSVDELKNALGHYEDLEEQGLLLKLPCKVGDMVWDNDFGKPCAYTITGFSLGTGEDYIDEPVTEKEIVYYCSNSSGSITESFAAIEIGKTVFLTQTEAEQKLKEMTHDNCKDEKL